MLIFSNVAAAIADSYLSGEKIKVVCFERYRPGTEYWLLQNNDETLILSTIISNNNDNR